MPARVAWACASRARACWTSPASSAHRHGLPRQFLDFHIIGLGNLRMFIHGVFSQGIPVGVLGKNGQLLERYDLGHSPAEVAVVGRPGRFQSRPRLDLAEPCIGQRDLGGQLVATDRQPFLPTIADIAPNAVSRSTSLR